MKEEWRPVVGFEGLYEVSNTGYIRSVDRLIKCKDGRMMHHKGTVLVAGFSNNGYLRVCLYKNKHKKHYLVHRLVAQAFLPNPDNLPCVNHRDEDKTNNRVDNLEWCTSEYNSNYGTRIDRCAKGHFKAINMYDKQGKLLKQFESLNKAKEFIGRKSAHTSISMVCKGHNKTAYGYVWKYADKPLTT